MIYIYIYIYIYICPVYISTDIYRTTGIYVTGLDMSSGYEDECPHEVETETQQKYFWIR